MTKSNETLLRRYTRPEAREVEYASTSIVCASPESQITSITEPDDPLGVWE